MPTVKFQLYLEEDSAEFLNRLCRRFGWTSTQAVDRLIRFYNAMQQDGEGLSIVHDETGEEQEIMFSGAEEAPYFAEVGQIAFDFVRRCTDGLTPAKGFPDLPTADVEGEYHG